MTLSHALSIGLLATSLIATTATAALAFPATATSAVNVRTGPGTGYTIVDQLHRGENVDVKQCTSGWCYVDHSGPDGWVSGKYLSRTGNPGGGYGGNPSGGFGNPSGGFSGSGPNFSFQFGFGNGHFQPRLNPRVCFYDGPNFTGASFCASKGTNYSHLGSWNNRISSVKVYGNATATVCQFGGYNGFCRAVTSDEWRLGPFLNNAVSSLRVH